MPYFNALSISMNRNRIFLRLTELLPQVLIAVILTMAMVQDVTHWRMRNTYTYMWTRLLKDSKNELSQGINLMLPVLSLQTSSSVKLGLYQPSSKDTIPTFAILGQYHLMMCTVLVHHHHHGHNNTSLQRSFSATVRRNNTFFSNTGAQQQKARTELAILIIIYGTDHTVMVHASLHWTKRD